jgi:ankyrin repeat protein
MEPSEQLWWACHSADKSQVQLLLESHHLTAAAATGDSPSKGQIDPNWKNDGYYRWTSLHQACCQGSPDIVSFLLNIPPEICQLDVNSRSFNPSDSSTHAMTPLHCAAMAGHARVAAVLLGDPRVLTTPVNGAGETPLWTAAFNGKTDVIKVGFSAFFF